ncbi:DNA-binding MarR family transcriptional regulator [Variovorax boronicumulans]|uniref:DNA-binding MarR family transcriptional regulator n=1 Tax=Variovorax boronicumulans TaxID=436515 RepID=A0AAW8D3F3_9BURK|nr:MarR family winged helix-turn-helix transcriptional regulator [Variovorax boronicumulans]MDP9893795.1 DNA-binding MarR family transcriptional regulator [Variovorax boronicumulans]MDQ0053612.1 DNA-binding MarR family transcriptional regulator [Variovorax boronicumulans]
MQRIVNDLEKENLVAFEANPHHRRAQLVVLTERGKQVYTDAMALQAPWINSLSDGIAVDDIKTMQKIMASLRQKLEQDTEEEEPG